MQISFNTYRPAFCAKFSKDSDTKEILQDSTRHMDTDLCDAYIVMKAMNDHKGGTFRANASIKDGLSISSSITGKTINFPTKYGTNIWRNMADILKTLDFSEISKSNFKSLFGTDPTPEEIKFYTQKYENIRNKFLEDSGTIDSVRNCQAKSYERDKLLKRARSLDTKCAGLKMDISLKQRQYILSLVG